MTKVYIVTYGIDGEGSSVHGVFLKEDDANTHADDIMQWSSWKWEGRHASRNGHTDTWSHEGGDYVQIQEWNV